MLLSLSLIDFLTPSVCRWSVLNSSSGDTLSPSLTSALLSVVLGSDWSAVGSEARLAQSSLVSLLLGWPWPGGWPGLVQVSPGPGSGLLSPLRLTRFRATVMAILATKAARRCQEKWRLAVSGLRLGSRAVCRVQVPWSRVSVASLH